MRALSGARLSRRLMAVALMAAVQGALGPHPAARSEPQVGTRGDNLIVGLSGPSTIRAGAGDDIMVGDSMTISPGLRPVFGIYRASTAANGREGDDESMFPVFSPDGRQVAFESLADDLVHGDGNGSSDIFVKDLVSGAISRVSTRADGGEANLGSSSPVFSPDGTKLAFESLASNLVDGDRRGYRDIFVKDLASGSIRRVSTTADGVQGNGDSRSPVFSPDCSKIAFESSADFFQPGDNSIREDIFLKDLETGAIRRVSARAGVGGGNRWSRNPIFSPDGTRIAFWSDATNLVPDDLNGMAEIFVKDLRSGAIERVVTGLNGAEANGGSSSPAFSPDGRRLAFESNASNLVVDDTGYFYDVFVKDLASGTIDRISVGARGWPGNGHSRSPAFSPDGSRIAFESEASDLVAGDTNGGDGNGNDIFVKTLASGKVDRVSARPDREEGNDRSFAPVFSPDGTKVAFHSEASNLVIGDRNDDGAFSDGSDVFVKDVVAAEAGNDVLLAGAGDDRVYGGPGDDVMTGNAGDDLLSGGAGRDTVVFSARPGPGNVDRIAGYVTADDHIWLSGPAFPEAGKPGPLAKSAFRSGTTNAATTPRHRIVHNRRTGVLLYDPDGTGTRAAVPFARVEPGLRLDASEFRIVD